ncbi:hypothetical protein [Bradyrhizobium sp. DASA03007]|uniref:hypothetical protein n=1 Tax=unclassified Bradyrhizobium TaxID=2631580 RepID=UPI003F6FC636
MIGHLFFLSLGAFIGFVLAALMKRRPRGSGISAELAEKMRTPLYIQHAKALAKFYGYDPESEWHRFKHRAIAEIIYKVR